MKRSVRFDDLPDVLTPTEAGLALRIGRNAVYEAIHQGLIPSFRVGRTIRIPKAGLIRSLGLSGAGTQNAASAALQAVQTGRSL